MSTKKEVVKDLEQVDEHVKVLESKLPWYRRLSRRYFNSTSFISYQVGGGMAWLKLVFGKKLLLIASTKFPVFYSLLAVIWDKIVLVVVATLAVFHEAVI